MPVAFLLGLGLFLFALNHDRKKSFYTAEPAAASSGESTQVQVFEPLPTPQPQAAVNGASQLPMPDDSAAASAQIIASPRPAPPPEATPVPPPAAPAPPPPPTAAPAASGRNSPPVPTHRPAPHYPAQALRAGIGGLVQVRIYVGPDGIPTSVAVVRSSGSRELDRAAQRAARNWRFQPAQVNGEPSTGDVVVPIQFTPSN